MPTNIPTIGQIAYEAYATSTDWKSAISGAPLPQWEAQADVVRAAWEAAGAAARAYIPPPPEVVPFDPTRAYLADELRFAATSRCTCGAGLAYHRDAHEIRDGAWRCSAAMMHALPTPDPFAGQHKELPFMVYEVKSEDQPSAQGATTRPEVKP